MSRSSRSSHSFSCFGTALAPFIIFIVVAGLALILVNHQIEKKVADFSNTTSSTVALAEATSTAWIFGVSAPTQASDRLFGVSSSTHAVQELARPSGWRISFSDHRDATLLRTDEVTRLQGKGGWNIPLRDDRGRQYEDVVIWGWFDDTHVALVGRKEESRVVLSVSRIGEMKELFKLLDNANPIGLEGARLWFSTFSPGEGIETAPQGPSTLFSVDGRGATSTVTADTQVIDRVLPEEHGALAYLVEGGQMKVRTPDGKAVWIGSGIPLVWMDATHLLFSVGNEIHVLDVLLAQASLFTTLPGQATFGAPLSSQPLL
jgi:hypothetical protein